MGAVLDFEPQNLALSEKNGDFMSPLELSGNRAGVPGLMAGLHETESEVQDAVHEITSEFPSKAAGALHEITSEFRETVHEMKSEFPADGQKNLHEIRSEFPESVHEIKSESDRKGRGACTKLSRNSGRACTKPRRNLTKTAGKVCTKSHRNWRSGWRNGCWRASGGPRR